MIAVDTNLLVYAHRAATPEHHAARRAIESACETGRGWGIASPCLSEFWSVVTHSAVPPRPSSRRKAHAFIASLVGSGAGEIWEPGPGFGRRLLALAEDLKVNGVRIFDLQISLIAFENGATEIWSHDRNFIAPPGLRLHDPLV